MKLTTLPSLSFTALGSALGMAATLFVVAGCTSTAATRFHTLMPAEPPAAAAPGTAAVARPRAAIVLEPIRLPAQVDQPQWLVRLPDDTVAILEQDRWTSPLQDELRQALLERLGTRWEAGTGRSVPGAGPPLRIALEVRRFDSVVGREARIDGSWSISAGEGPGSRVSQCEWSWREPALGGTEALAAAHRRIVARLGDALGESLDTLARGRSFTCPARETAR